MTVRFRQRGRHDHHQTSSPPARRTANGRYRGDAEDWDIWDATGEPVRLHGGGGDWPSIGDGYWSAELWVGTMENTNGALTPSMVTLNADHVELTPEQARRYAGYLLEAADVAQRAGLETCHPWPGGPRVNIQNDNGKAKPYQVRQVLKAIDKKGEP